MRSRINKAVRKINDDHAKIKAKHEEIEADCAAKGWGRALPEGVRVLTWKESGEWWYKMYGCQQPPIRRR